MNKSVRLPFPVTGFKWGNASVSLSVANPLRRALELIVAHWLSRHIPQYASPLVFGVCLKIDNLFQALERY